MGLTRASLKVTGPKWGSEECQEVSAEFVRLMKLKGECSVLDGQ
jgi:hypothetical protein